MELLFFYNKQAATITINLLVCLLPFDLLFFHFYLFIYVLHFNQGKGELEHFSVSSLFYFLFFYIHCAVSYFGSVLWLK